jgi:hypothetical protein
MQYLSCILFSPRWQDTQLFPLWANTEFNQLMLIRNKWFGNITLYCFYRGSRLFLFSSLCFDVHWVWEPQQMNTKTSFSFLASRHLILRDTVAERLHTRPWHSRARQNTLCRNNLWATVIQTYGKNFKSSSLMRDTTIRHTVYKLYIHKTYWTINLINYDAWRICNN